MSDEDVKEQEAEMSQDPVDKEEFTGYLTSTGRIKQALANSLYEQGLDSYEKLESGDEEYFRTFKRVGPTSAEALIELGKKKKPEATGPLEGDDLKELLLTLPRIGKAQVEHIFSAGYDTGRKIVEGGVDDLLTVKGIGAGKAEAILNAVKPLVPEDEVKIEDATAEMDEEEKEEEEEGFFSRMAKKIRGIFGKGDDKEETEDSEGEGSPEEGDDEPSDEEGSEEEAKQPDEEEKAEEPVEEPVEDVKAEEEPPVEESEEEKVEEPEAEAPEEEETSEESSEEKEEEPAGEEKVEEEIPGKEDKGLFARIMGFFKKDKGEDAEEEKPAEEEEKSEEEAPGEGEKSEEDSEETPSEGEDEPSDEEKVEEPVEEKSGEEKEEAPEEAEALEEEKPEIEKFHDIPGISAVNADKLYEAGYSNVDELREAVWDDLTLIEGIGEKTAKKIIEAVSK